MVKLSLGRRTDRKPPFVATACLFITFAWSRILNEEHNFNFSNAIQISAWKFIIWAW